MLDFVPGIGMVPGLVLEKLNLWSQRRLGDFVGVEKVSGDCAKVTFDGLRVCDLVGFVGDLV